MLIQPKRFTVAEYHRLAEFGILQPSDRTELIRGEILCMAAKGTKHSVCCTNLNRALHKLVADHALIRCQDPIFVPPDSEPEPDFAIVRDRSDHYLSGHPTSEDILLVIEIADSSLAYDREVKGNLYAEAGIPYYWLFNLIDHHLEIYSEPFQDGQGKTNYAHRHYMLSNQDVVLPIFSELNLTLSLDKIFPSS